MPDAVVIAAPNLVTLEVAIQGTAPLVQHRFSEKMRKQMLAAQMEPAKAKSRKAKDPRDPEEDYLQALHVSDDGEWYGHPAPAFRSAMISACKISGFMMTRAKLSIFVEPDGFGEDGTPLVRLHGEPEPHEAAVRLESGVASIAIRPMWRHWKAKLRITYDADQFGQTDIINLLYRAGLQVGVGEGRADSKKSHGQGWGSFRVVTEGGVA